MFCWEQSRVLDSGFNLLIWNQYLRGFLSLKRYFIHFSF